MNLLKAPYDDEDMPVQGALGCPTADGQFISDSMTMYQYYALQQKAAQKKVSKDFDAIFATVKAGTYATAKEFATAMNKSQSWVNSFRRVAISSHRVTGKDWRAFFKKGEHGNG